MKQQIQQTLKKELTRNEFLKLTAAGVLALLGASRIMDALTKFGSPEAAKVTSANSYGSSSYGM